MFSVFDPSKYTHTPGAVDTFHSGEAPARPTHVTFNKIHLFETILFFINLYYRTIISPINISIEMNYLFSPQAITVWV